MFFDALRVKIRDEGTVRNKAVYLAVGVLPEGKKDVLGIWIEQTEGARFWLRVMAELKNRGVADVLIAVVDGREGLPGGDHSGVPRGADPDLHRASDRLLDGMCLWKERKAVAGALKAIYRAGTVEAAQAALEAFDASPWGRKYPAIAAAWRRNWEQVIPFFAYPPEVRRIIYTTNAIESLHSQVRRSVRARGHFPTDEAATKLIWLVLREITRDWRMPPIAWHAARAQFAILFGDRFEMTR